MNRCLARAAIALLLVPLVVGCSALAPGGSSPTPTSLPVLSPGTHTTQAFQPATAYTVPDGWVNRADIADYFSITPAIDENNGVHLFHNAQALSQDASCPTAAQPGVGASAAALAAWIGSLKGLNVSPPAMVTVSGLPATRIDISILASWTRSCPFANGLPVVPLLYRPGTSLGWWLAGSEKLRLFLVDVPGQGTVIVDLDSFDGAGFGDLLTVGTGIVKSLQFAAQ